MLTEFFIPLHRVSLVPTLPLIMTVDYVCLYLAGVVLHSCLQRDVWALSEQRL